MGFVVKWFIVYPSIAIFGAGMVIMIAPFYGLFWVVRRSLRNRRRRQSVAQCFPVQQPLPQRPAPCPVQRPYGFVPARRPVQPRFPWFRPAPTGAPVGGGAPFWVGLVCMSWGVSSSRLGEPLSL